MCGIAGFSLAPDEDINSRRLALTLFKGILPRGQDAAGLAWQKSLDSGVFYQKWDQPADKILQDINVPKDAQNVVLHTRFATQGDSNVLGGSEDKELVNCHPIISRGLAGVHNGVISNDSSIFRTTLADWPRKGQVDSEAIFARLAHATVGLGKPSNEAFTAAVLEALEDIEGSMAVAWLDGTNQDGFLHLARGSSSPLIAAWTPRGSLVFASTRSSLQQLIDTKLITELHNITEFKEGEYVAILQGIPVVTKTFKADHGYTQQYKTYGHTDYYGQQITSKFRKTYSQPKLPVSPQITNREGAERAASLRVAFNSKLSGIMDGSWTLRHDADIENLVYKRRYREIAAMEETHWTKEIGGELDIGSYVNLIFGPDDEMLLAEIIAMPNLFPGGFYTLLVAVPDTWGEPGNTVVVRRNIDEFDLAEIEDMGDMKLKDLVNNDSL